MMWAPKPQQGSAQARLARADVLEASLSRYRPDCESTFTTHHGNYTPDEFTPLIKLGLRVYDTADTDPDTAFEVTGEWRVPSLCLSAITVTAWSSSSIRPLPGPGERSPRTGRAAPCSLKTRTCRVTDLEGRTTAVTRRVDRQLQQMRISREAGGVAMNGDTIDLRRLDPHTAARYAALADQDRTHPEEQARHERTGRGSPPTRGPTPG